MKKSIGIKELIHPNPSLIIGTYDKDGRANATNIAWAGIAGSSPAAISIAVRPSRYCHEAIMENKAFTAMLPTAKFVSECDYFGIVSGRDVDKLASTGLTAAHAEKVNAPFIEEFPFVIECEMTKHLDLNSHTLFIGEIKDVKIDEEFILEKGKIDFAKMGVLSFDWSSGEYLGIGEKVAKAFSSGLKFVK